MQAFLITLLVVAAPSDQEMIQGGWYAHEDTINGQRWGIESAPDPSWKFVRGRVIMYGYDAGTFRLGPAKRTIDVTIEPSLLSRGKRFLGIYRLEGDTLTLCYTEAPAARPRYFEPGPGRTLT